MIETQTNHEQQCPPGEKPKIQQAVAIQDATAQQLQEDWDSTEEIRRWREAQRRKWQDKLPGNHSDPNRGKSNTKE